MKRDRQRGSAMLITMILISALLAGAAVLVSLQMASNRSTDLTRTGISALYCAEAGLTATRTIIANSQQLWATSLSNPPAAPVEPSWLSGVSHDVDGDGSNNDFEIHLESYPGDPTAAQYVWVASRCKKYPDTPKEVRELVGYTTQNKCYGSQQGGCASNNNMNKPY